MKWRYLTLAVALMTVAAACGDPDSTADTQPIGALPPDTTSSTSDGVEVASGSVEPFAGDWILVSGIPVVDGFPVTMTASVNEIGGRAACNLFGTSAIVDGSSIEFGEFSSTAMACEPDVMDAESAFTEALASVTAWKLIDGQLHFDGADVSLVFDRAPEVPTADIVGTTWVLETVVEDDMAFMTVGEPATLILGQDGTLTGSTGCRTLTGRWIEANAQIVFTEFSAGGQCSADVQDQDGRVVTVLGDGFAAEVDGDLLSLTSMGNEGLVYRAQS